MCSCLSISFQFITFIHCICPSICLYLSRFYLLIYLSIYLFFFFCGFASKPRRGKQAQEGTKRKPMGAPTSERQKSDDRLEGIFFNGARQCRGSAKDIQTQEGARTKLNREPHTATKKRVDASSNAKPTTSKTIAPR